MLIRSLNAEIGASLSLCKTNISTCPTDPSRGRDQQWIAIDCHSEGGRVDGKVRNRAGDGRRCVASPPPQDGTSLINCGNEFVATIIELSNRLFSGQCLSRACLA